MTRRVTLLALLAAALLSAPSAEARGYGRRGWSTPPMTPFGPMYDPTLWRQAGGNPYVYDQLLQQRMMMVQQRAMMQQERMLQKQQRQQSAAPKSKAANRPQATKAKGRRRPRAPPKGRQRRPPKRPRTTRLLERTMRRAFPRRWARKGPSSR